MTREIVKYTITVTMVLAELGSKITSALRKVNDVTVVDEGMYIRLFSSLSQYMFSLFCFVFEIKKIKKKNVPAIHSDDQISG